MFRNWIGLKKYAGLHSIKNSLQCLEHSLVAFVQFVQLPLNSSYDAYMVNNNNTHFKMYSSFV